MTLLELLQLMKKRWYLCVILPVLAALATAGYSWGFMPNEYTSSVSLYVLTTSEDSNTSGVTSGDMTASQQLANDIAVLAESHRVVSATADALGMQDLDDFKVSVSSETTNRVITLNVTGMRPEAVAQVANELAEQTSDSAVEIMDVQAVNIIDEAQASTTPSGPNRVMYTAVAFLAGLFAAIALIVLMDMMDTTVRDPEDAAELLGVPVIGRMPAIKGKGN